LYQHSAGDHLTGFLPDIEAKATSIIVGVEYRTRHSVRTCLVFGDSIDNAEGRDVLLPGADAAFVASQATGDGTVAWETLNLAWSGATSVRIAQHVADAIEDDVLGDMAIVPLGSPNDARKGFRSSVASLEQLHNQNLAALEAAGVSVLSRTWAPTNRSIKKFGHGDELRRQYNAKYVKCRPNHIFDADAVLSGEEIFEQVQFREGYTSDGIHPNDRGIAALADQLRYKLDEFANVSRSLRSSRR